jgi:hypothetical protein
MEFVFVLFFIPPWLNMAFAAMHSQSQTGEKKRDV